MKLVNFEGRVSGDFTGPTEAIVPKNAMGMRSKMRVIPFDNGMGTLWEAGEPLRVTERIKTPHMPPMIRFEGDSFSIKQISFDL
jgi:hypothetical protein